LHQTAPVGVSESRDPKLFGRAIIFEVFQPVWKSHRRTDGMQSHNRALSARGNKRYISAYLIFFKNYVTGLHFAADNVSLSSLKFLWWAPELLFISASGAFRPFKVIQGHWYWCQSKAPMRLPISS